MKDSHFNILAVSVISVILLSFGFTESFAFPNTFGPPWVYKGNTTEGTTSYIIDKSGGYTTDGDLQGFAYKEPDSTEGRAAFEYGKLIHVEKGNTRNNLSVSVFGLVTSATFFNQTEQSDAHISLYPTVHKNNGVENKVGMIDNSCTLAPYQVVESNVSADNPIKLIGTLDCRNLEDDESYWVNAYVQFETTKVDQSSVFGAVKNIFLIADWAP